MKRCPSCKRTYTDTSLNFCLEDGTPLVQDAPPAPDPNATVRYPAPRDTAEPPPTEIYRPDTPVVTSPSPPPPPQWSPTPAAMPQRKSNAVWWVLGGLAVLAVIGIGFVVVLIALSNMGGNTNDSNTNVVANRNSNISTNANASPSVNTNTNSNSDTLPSSFTDDFSETKWGAGNFRFGDIWYTEDEYHMRSKENTFIVMYAPSEVYRTQDATIKVTARSVDGSVPSAGFGLMFHCAQSKAKQLEDYALLIYPETEAAYEVIMHKDGNQSSVVSKTKTSAIRSGSAPNQLEVRIKGAQVEFYVNGQYLTSITDTQNFKGGRAGFYTSDTVEVAFDDLEIQRQTP
jgi:hypothetical protein